MTVYDNTDEPIHPTPIDLNQVFSGDKVYVNYLVERLLEEIDRHEPVKNIRRPGCDGCNQLYERYRELLKHLVAFGETAHTANKNVQRVRKVFEDALRRAFPKETNKLETNPRIPRKLENYDPESLGEVLVTFVRQLGEDKYTSGMHYSDMEKERLQNDITTLKRQLEEARKSSIDVTSVRKTIGSTLLGIPDPLVDQLLSGKTTLFAFLRELAGPTGTRFELDGTTIEVRITSSSGRQTAPSQLNGLQPVENPEEKESDESSEIEELVPVGSDNRGTTAEQMRKHLATCMTDGALFSLKRLKRAESGLGIDLGRGLIELEQGGMIDVIRTLDGDALILPTDEFRSVVDSIGGEPRSAHQLWASMRHLLRDPKLQRAVAEALCPFLERDYDLLRFDLGKGEGGSIWLTLSIPSNAGPGTGLLGCIISPGPHRLPSLPPYCTAIWITGDQAHLKSLPPMPQGPAVYYGPPEQSGDDSAWVTIRSNGDDPMR